MGAESGRVVPAYKREQPLRAGPVTTNQSYSQAVWGLAHTVCVILDFFFLIISGKTKGRKSVAKGKWEWEKWGSSYSLSSTDNKDDEQPEEHGYNHRPNGNNQLHISFLLCTYNKYEKSENGII